MKELFGKTIKNITKLDYANKIEYDVSYDLDGDETEIEFTDGTKARIWVSEYGGIDLLKKDKI